MCCYLARGATPPLRFSGFKHIFCENGVALGGITNKHVGDGADKFAVLNDRRATHECVNMGPTNPHAKTLENRRQGVSFAAVFNAFYLGVLPAESRPAIGNTTSVSFATVVSAQSSTISTSGVIYFIIISSLTYRAQCYSYLRQVCHKPPCHPPIRHKYA